MVEPVGASIDPTPGDRPGGRRRLRSATLVAAPIFVVGLIAGTLLLASVLWGAWNDEHLGVAFWSVVVVSGASGEQMRAGSASRPSTRRPLTSETPS